MCVLQLPTLRGALRSLPCRDCACQTLNMPQVKREMLAVWVSQLQSFSELPNLQWMGKKGRGTVLSLNGTLRIQQDQMIDNRTGLETGKHRVIPFIPGFFFIYLISRRLYPS